jgi:proteasome beta subunit
MIAKQTLKRFVDPRADEQAATQLAIEALFDAAEDDSATGGPDLVRRIYPIVSVIDETGYRELDDETVAGLVEEVVDEHAARRSRATTETAEPPPS